MADRNPSKKRRQTQNRAARDARSARSAAAGRSTDDIVDDAPTSTASTGSIFSRKRGSAAGSGTSGRPSRTATGVARATGTAARPARVAATKAAEAKAAGGKGGAARDPKATSGSGASKAAATTVVPPRRPLPPWADRFGGNEPGGRMILLAFLMSVLASVLACVMKVVAYTETVNGKQVTHAVTALHFGVGRGLSIVAPAPVAVGLSILIARPENRRRTWYFGAAALFLVTFTTGFLYLPAFGVMVWGCMQARKAALAEVGGDPKALRARDRAALRRDRDEPVDDGELEYGDELVDELDEGVGGDADR